MLNKLILLMFASFLLCGLIIGANHRANLQSSDDYVRDRIVLLKSATGSCTGVEIVAPSGKIYTLTAGHCTALLSAKKTLTAKLENGKEYTLKFIALDKASDLMLLEGADSKGLLISYTALSKHEHVYTMTHGLGFPSYRTDGKVLMEKLVKTGPINGFEMFISAPVVPGSSGGAVLNAKNELVGIVSVAVGYTMFSGIVKLENIHTFLKDR